MIGLMDYISRIGKARGFGIQSPWAYSFVRDVVMEQTPYYIYKEIDSRVKARCRKWTKLYFRLANYVQPQCCAMMGDSHYADERCYRQGCLTMEQHSGMPREGRRSLCVMDMAGYSNSEVLKALEAMDEGSVLVLEGINDDCHQQVRWQEIQNWEQVGCTFDLYRIAICFKPGKRPAQHYKLNF